MSPVKTRSTATARRTQASDRGYKADPDDINDDDDFYGMRELKHQLAALSLKLKDTVGDGNCLFRACADQFMGSEREHGPLRQEVCQYIEDHGEHFRSFLDNETVEAHAAQMRKNGTYGGNIELVAFARMKKVDIKVYQPGYIFVIEGVDVKKEGSTPGQRPVMHIAYHSWEHYSSIRNIDGPHEGLPEINPKKVEQKPLAKLTNQDPPRSIERMIMKVSGTGDLALVRELMQKYSGDLDRVYSDLAEKAFEEDNPSEASAESRAQGGAVITPGKESASQSFSPTVKSDASSDNTTTKANISEEDSDNNALADDYPREETASIASPDPDSPVSLSQPGSRAPLRSGSAGNSAASSSPLPTIARILDDPDGDTEEQEGGAEEETKAEGGFEGVAKGVVPKKRMSSREKKELAKRNQKLNRKNKGRVTTTEVDGDDPGQALDSGRGVEGTSKNMRELFV